jgi:hypothetical protein
MQLLSQYQMEWHHIQREAVLPGLHACSFHRWALNLTEENSIKKAQKSHKNHVFSGFHQICLLGFDIIRMRYLKWSSLYIIVQTPICPQIAGVHRA